MTRYKTIITLGDESKVPPTSKIYYGILNLSDEIIEDPYSVSSEKLLQAQLLGAFADILNFMKEENENLRRNNSGAKVPPETGTNQPKE